MTKSDDIKASERGLDSCQRLKLFIFQHLIDRTQAVRPLRMSGWRQVVQAGWMAEKKSRHSLDLNIREPSWKCLS
jgi:hypothetical protein